MDFTRAGAHRNSWDKVLSKAELFLALGRPGGTAGGALGGHANVRHTATGFCLLLAASPLGANPVGADQEARAAIRSRPARSAPALRPSSGSPARPQLSHDPTPRLSRRPGKGRGGQRPEEKGTLEVVGRELPKISHPPVPPQAPQVCSPAGSGTSLSAASPPPYWRTPCDLLSARLDGVIRRVSLERLGPGTSGTAGDIEARKWL